MGKVYTAKSFERVFDEIREARQLEAAGDVATRRAVCMDLGRELFNVGAAHGDAAPDHTKLHRAVRGLLAVCQGLDTARSRRSLRGFGAIPAGGEVFDGDFEMDGTDLEEPRSRRKSLKGNKDGRGPNCVYDDDGKLVRCFAKMETAKQVARGFGAGFTAKKRKRG